MGRKKRFKNKRSGDAIWGGSRRRLHFAEMEERPGGEIPENGRPREREPFAGLKKVLPRSMSRRLEKVRRIHVAIALVLAVVIGVLIWFFAFVYPSPITATKPDSGSCINSRKVKLEATFSRPVEQENINLKVDGKDVTADAKLEPKKVTYESDYEDGDHKAQLKIDVGGLMGKRDASWSFTVDTTAPALELTSEKVTALDGNPGEVKVDFAGKVEKGCTLEVDGKQLAVDDKGAFEGSSTCSRTESLKLTAVDGAGNKSNAYVVTQQDPAAKGAHVSIYIAASNSDFDDMLGLVERTELNSLEVDLKDERGQIAFDLDYPLAQEINSVNDFVNLDACVDKMRYRDIYAICRVVVFKDPKLAESAPQYAVKDKYGGLWGDGQWVDPYSREVWDYNLAVAVAAAKAGFNEVQFDYVRFPSDGDTSTCVFPSQDDRTPGEVIEGFLSCARETLAEYNVFISADVFGLTASKQGEMGIGQSVHMIAEHVDYLSPMVYPSHYNPGEYDIKSPENNPGDTVAESMKEFKEALADTNAGLRPWLQDFSLRVTYTPDMVRRQIDSVEQAGINEWLLWDPDCSYSESALKPASE